MARPEELKGQHGRKQSKRKGPRNVFFGADPVLKTSTLVDQFRSKGGGGKGGVVRATKGQKSPRPVL